jgi:cobalamin biosynthesis Mg chelatase CobN
MKRKEKQNMKDRRSSTQEEISSGRPQGEGMDFFTSPVAQTEAEQTLQHARGSRSGGERISTPGSTQQERRGSTQVESADVTARKKKLFSQIVHQGWPQLHQWGIVLLLLALFLICAFFQGNGSADYTDCTMYCIADQLSHLFV